MTSPAGSSERSDAKGERSIEPAVERPRSGLSGPAIGAIAGLAALILFGSLEARRQSASAPAVTARNADMIGTDSSLPALYVPPEPPAAPGPEPVYQPPVFPATPRAPATLPPAPAAFPVQLPQTYTPPPPPTVERPPRTADGSALVVDVSQPRGSAEGPSGGQAPSDAGQSGSSTGRVRAGAIANRSTTVAQGTLIPAILETAFNSSRAGFARALVQRDIYGFDGTRVLVPRGSRLIGEYRADATAGQKRAFVMWTRLIRPDGVTVSIGSPATDTLGTGGVRAKVDTHFFERFSGAILQSALDIGVNLASRSVDRSVIVALPGTNQPTSSASNLSQTQIPPTLSVRQGTSVSVFVARDLDFTDVDTPR